MQAINAGGKSCCILIAALFLNGLAQADTSPQQAFPFLFSPSLPDRPVVWMDYYHRSLPDTRLGSQIITGGYANQYGRYAWDDFSHGNSFDPFFLTLEREFALEVRREPFTADALSGTDIVLIMNPQSEHAPLISNNEIETLDAFVYAGGSLIILLNSATEERLHETFEREQTGKLLTRFGIGYDTVCTGYVNIAISEFHPYFYDMSYFHYGAGCIFHFLDNAQNPRVLLDVHEAIGQPKVRGPGIVKVDYGKGKVLAVGDNGSWSGNMARPNTDNTRFLTQLMRYAKATTGVTAFVPKAGDEAHYDYRSVSFARYHPQYHPLSQMDQPHTEPVALTAQRTAPLMETRADLHIRFNEHPPSQAFPIDVQLSNIQRAGEPVEGNEQTLNLHISRMGHVGNVSANGRIASLMKGDTAHLFAFIPNGNIRPGDRWEKIQVLRLPNAQLANQPAHLPIPVEMIYLRDEELDGVATRVIRSQTSAWLNDLNIRIEDILPDELTKTWGGNALQFYAERGGRLMYRAEQWIDSTSGQVRKAVIRARIGVWIDDLQTELVPGVDNIDASMIALLHYETTMELRKRTD